MVTIFICLISVAVVIKPRSFNTSTEVIFLSWNHFCSLVLKAQDLKNLLRRRSICRFAYSPLNKLSSSKLSPSQILFSIVAIFFSAVSLPCFSSTLTTSSSKILLQSGITSMLFKGIWISPWIALNERALYASQEAQQW